MNWKGEILLESLQDQSLLDHLHIDSVQELIDEDGMWHVYKVSITEDQIKMIGISLIDGPWFMHFGNGEETIVVFKNSYFKFLNADKETVQRVKEYAKKLGIPEEELQLSL